MCSSTSQRTRYKIVDTTLQPLQAIKVDADIYSPAGKLLLHREVVTSAQAMM